MPEGKKVKTEPIPGFPFSAIINHYGFLQFFYRWIDQSPNRDTLLYYATCEKEKDAFSIFLFKS